MNTLTLRKNLKNMDGNLDKTMNIYAGILEIAAPDLELHAGGQEILSHARTERREAWKVKIEVQAIREGLKEKGWFERHILPLSGKKSLGNLPDRVMKSKTKVTRFLHDAVSTSSKAAQIMAMSVDPFIDPANGPGVFTEKTATALVAVMEANEP